MKNKIQSKTRAAAYIRVSTDEQVSEGQSLENQEARIRAYADSQGWELADTYREEGQSGKDLQRPELSRMLADIEAGNLDIVLVYKVDRLTRKQKDLWYLLEDKFESNQVGFKSVVEPFDTTTAQGKAFLGMLAVFAQLERDTIAERTKDTLANKKTNGEWVGRIPFGYRVGESGILEKDEDEQRTIERIRRLRKKGRSYRDIAKTVGIGRQAVSNLLNGNIRVRNAKYNGRLNRPGVH